MIVSSTQAATPPSTTASVTINLLRSLVSSTERSMHCPQHRRGDHHAQIPKIITALGKTTYVFRKLIASGPILVTTKPSLIERNTE